MEMNIWDEKTISIRNSAANIYLNIYNVVIHYHMYIYIILFIFLIIFYLFEINDILMNKN